VAVVELSWLLASFFLLLFLAFWFWLPGWKQNYPQRKPSEMPADARSQILHAPMCAV
jgi:hypothetical protein|tara:strand:- start:312 stop:482 length:171 start_codon:yes stop_codon:yes gene_type:complete